MIYSFILFLHVVGELLFYTCRFLYSTYHFATVAIPPQKMRKGVFLTMLPPTPQRNKLMEQPLTIIYMTVPSSIVAFSITIVIPARM